MLLNQIPQFIKSLFKRQYAVLSYDKVIAPWNVEKFAPITEEQTAEDSNEEDELLLSTTKAVVRQASKNLDTYEKFDEVLGTLRLRLLAKNSVLLPLDEKTLAIPADVFPKSKTHIRIFPARKVNFEYGMDLYLGRIIDNARALLAIAHYQKSNPRYEETAVALQAILAAVQRKFSPILAEEKRLMGQNPRNEEVILKLHKQAIKKYFEYYAALQNLLTSKNFYKKEKDAAAGLSLMRDFLWATDRNTEVVFSIGDKPNHGTLSFQPLFDKDKEKQLAQDKTEAWYLQHAKKHTWFETYIERVGADTVLQYGGSSSNRNMPNPANMWEEYEIQGFTPTGKETLEWLIIPGLSTGITNPYNLAKLADRAPITERNHRILLGSDFLAIAAKNHMALRKGIDPELKTGDDAIVIPILHQTLVSTISTSEQGMSYILEKEAAYQAIRAAVIDKFYYYDETTAEVYEEQSANNTRIKVKFDLKTSNISQNMIRVFSHTFNNDIESSHALIKQASTMLALLQAHDGVATEFKGDLKILLNTLNQDDSVFLPLYATWNSRVLLDKVTRQLHGGKIANIPATTQRQLGLLLQASYELKVISQESWFGSARRKINNYFENRYARLLIRPITFVIFKLANPLWYLYILAQGIIRFIGNGSSKSMYHASYQRLVAHCLGITITGCKSRIDREGSVRAFTRTLINKYDAEGVIAHWDINDRLHERESLRASYGRDGHQHKMNLAGQATGISATNDAGHQPHDFRDKTPLERKICLLTEDLRRDKRKTTRMSFESYCESKPASSDQPGTANHEPLQPSPGSSLDRPLFKKNREWCLLHHRRPQGLAVKPDSDQTSGCCWWQKTKSS